MPNCSSKVMLLQLMLSKRTSIMLCCVQLWWQIRWQFHADNYFLTATVVVVVIKALSATLCSRETDRERREDDL